MYKLISLLPWRRDSEAQQHCKAVLRGRWWRVLFLARVFVQRPHCCFCFGCSCDPASFAGFARAYAEGKALTQPIADCNQHCFQEANTTPTGTWSATFCEWSLASALRGGVGCALGAGAGWVGFAKSVRWWFGLPMLSRAAQATNNS